MNAKELLRQKMNEADEPNIPPGDPRGPRRPMPRRRPPPGGEFGGGDFPDDPRDIERMVGGPGGGAPRGQFNPKELSQLKDVLILILANLAHSDLDAQIGQALMAGQELDPGQLQHILDEARNIQVPDSHGPLLQKIFDRLSQSQ